MSKRSELPTNKPRIHPEARNRIRAFVRAIEAAEKEHGVTLSVQDDMFVFRDLHRTDDWNGYGQWDAMIYDAAKPRQLRAANLEFEEFDSWGSV